MATSHIVSVDELHALRKTLSSPEMDQGHLFAGWPSDPGNYTTKQLDVLQQLHRFSFQYKGGVASLIQNGRRLLSASQCCPYINVESPAYVFHAPSLEDRSAELDKLEGTSSSLLKKTVFALVAGGLGERLGFPGIKVGLPLNTATGITYLEHYCSWAKAVGGEQVPFVIMTSDDTHTATLELIEELQLKMPNLRVVKQDTVFCFSDREAHLAIDDKGMLIRKPHGHGDIHTLLHASVSVGTDGKEKLLVDQWVDEGYSYIAFFQDTNGASTTTIPISLAISNRERLDMNMTCVQRRPKEALGLLCRVQLEPSKEWKTINVEYNDFEEVAKTLTKEGGDVAVAGTQYSAYPGNTNTIIYNLVSYASVLKASGGAVPEFINPKYTDATKTTFKKPARIESLMQDFARLFKDGEHRVGGCVFDRFCYQPVKNSMEASLALHEKEASLFSALSGEADGYELTRRRLMAVGVPLQYHPQAVEVIVADRIPAHLFPIITADAVCLRGGFLREWSRVFPSPTKVRISPSSVLCLEGNVVIESLSLDGVLRISGPTSPCAPPLVVTGVNVANAHWQVRPTSSNDSNPVDLIRGFVLEKSEAQHLRVDSAATNQQSRQHKSSL